MTTAAPTTGTGMAEPEALIYPGKINALNGESGSGKTWVALQAVAELVLADEFVIWVDLEDGPNTIITRLRTLGVPDPHITHYVIYLRPDRRAGVPALELVDTYIADHQPALIVIDSIGELISLQGCKPNDDDDVARLYRAIPRRWANLGPAVLLIDHVPKNSEGTLYGIGSQRKRAAIDGASYMVETIRGFSASEPGRLKLVVAKDRHGTFTTGSVAAEVDMTPDAGTLRIDVRAPEKAATGVGPRQTANMRRLCEWLHEQGGTVRSVRAIKDAKVLAEKKVDQVVKQASAEGWISVDDAVRGNPSTVRLVEMFDEDIAPPASRTPSDASDAG